MSEPRAWRLVRIDPEWEEYGFGEFACQCGETLAGIGDAGETRQCGRCGRTYRLEVRIMVSEPEGDEG